MTDSLRFQFTAAGNEPAVQLHCDHLSKNISLVATRTLDQ